MTDLTVAEAARRVHRSRSTIERWIEGGLPVRWSINSRGDRVRLITEEALMSAFREALANTTRPAGRHPRTPN
ncbi:MAG TPA: helix-turn-helix domain-containing protein [Naasia sp.]|jgi:hypothetical protein